MTTPARALADRYNLTLADQLPPRPKPADDHNRVRTRWSPQKRMAFDTLGPYALCVVGTDGPCAFTLYDAAGGITRRIGHNRGCWPVKLARSGSWRDTVTPRVDVGPFATVAVQVRVWCAADAHEKRLAMALGERLAQMADEAGGSDQLMNGFLDLGPDLSFEILEMEIHACAERLGLQTWDDDGLEAELDRMVARAANRMGR